MLTAPAVFLDRQSGRSETMSNSFDSHPARYWHRLEDGRTQCDLCPRFCKLRPGQRGLCFVRAADPAGEIVLTTYGRSSGFCVDPIEKKPLNQFYPATKVLSFGTAGCNLGCRFCQNWDISKARLDDLRSREWDPVRVVDLAVEQGAPGIAFTYNDPVIWAEFAIDVAQEAHRRGLFTVFVTAGYVNAAAQIGRASCRERV